ncbi:hypothetical protein CONLIGDRAFT_621614 [Coniochaeta ligniaria NRRL 30616]|uniref:Uncharacterized protein n=1 Tax=Coniochaeta ligniaria NRRL 30616 TaxID=1408157 RepID=A0A1J7JDT3_9PEZI|nr:hypothetical protein CONLIGDRAFT_621614 [Coniochaeta ligniaria NRRL 30616]
MGSGSAEAAGVMSFFAVVYGFIIGWAGCAADYNVRMPRDTSRTKLSLSIWGGNFCGAVATEVLGAAFMTAVAADPAFAAAYDDRGIGGVLGQALIPIHGFGKFLLVLLALSIIGCNLVNIYSLAFMCQNFHPIMIRVPRFVWTLLGSAAYIAVAIAGENSFAAVLESFLSIIGYYTTPFLACVAIEHFLFRKGKYPLEDWNNMDVLPYGIAGIAALVMAFVGAVLAMDQEWYHGVVSRAVKPDGAELGWIFSLIFSVVAFIPVRYLEKKYTGR